MSSTVYSRSACLVIAILALPSAVASQDINSCPVNGCDDDQSLLQSAVAKSSSGVADEQVHRSLENTLLDKTSDGQGKVRGSHHNEKHGQNREQHHSMDGLGWESRFESCPHLKSFGQSACRLGPHRCLRMPTESETPHLCGEYAGNSACRHTVDKYEHEDISPYVRKWHDAHCQSHPSLIERRAQVVDGHMSRSLEQTVTQKGNKDVEGKKENKHETKHASRHHAHHKQLGEHNHHQAGKQHGEDTPHNGGNRREHHEQQSQHDHHHSASTSDHHHDGHSSLIERSSGGAVATRTLEQTVTEKGNKGKTDHDTGDHHHGEHAHHQSGSEHAHDQSGSEHAHHQSGSEHAHHQSGSKHSHHESGSEHAHHESGSEHAHHESGSEHAHHQSGSEHRHESHRSLIEQGSDAVNGYDWDSKFAACPKLMAFGKVACRGSPDRCMRYPSDTETPDLCAEYTGNSKCLSTLSLYQETNLAPMVVQWHAAHCEAHQSLIQRSSQHADVHKSQSLEQTVVAKEKGNQKHSSQDHGHHAKSHHQQGHHEEQGDHQHAHHQHDHPDSDHHHS